MAQRRRRHAVSQVTQRAPLLTRVPSIAFWGCQGAGLAGREPMPDEPPERLRMARKPDGCTLRATERVPWRKWGPYLSEREWGTVREDYSATGDAWNHFPHDHARSHAYRWGEDGLAGFSDDQQRLCFALALWNGQDPILKERLFGLTNAEGNHGEDVKEYYFYLDSTPTHSYMKWLYKYPQRPYPYDDLLETNRRRSRRDSEYELLDTGVFEDDRYFDVFVEYAKATPEDILIRVTAINRGPEAAPLHVLPTLWFRNTWRLRPDAPKPVLREVSATQPGGRGVARRARRSVAVRRRCAALVVHRERDEQPAFVRYPVRDGPREGRHQRFRRSRPTRCRQLGRHGHEGRRTLPGDDRPGPARSVSSTAVGPGAGQDV